MVGPFHQGLTVILSFGLAMSLVAAAAWPAPPAERVPDIRCPLLGLYGADDHRITDAVPALAETMRAAGKRFEYEIYPGAPHAFFNDTRSSYRVTAARAAWARALAFLSPAAAPR